MTAENLDYEVDTQNFSLTGGNTLVIADGGLAWIQAVISVGYTAYDTEGELSQEGLPSAEGGVVTVLIKKNGTAIATRDFYIEPYVLKDSFFVQVCDTVAASDEITVELSHSITGLTACNIVWATGGIFTLYDAPVSLSCTLYKVT